MRRTFEVSLLAFVILLLAAPAAPQDWVGRARVEGTITDLEGNPVQGATVRIHRPGDPEAGPPPVESDRRGRWAFLGLSGGAWEVSVEKEGYQPVGSQVQLSQAGRNPPFGVELAPIPEEVIQARELDQAVQEVQQANELLAQGEHARARELYQGALPRLEPEHQAAVLRAIARTHFQEDDAAAAEQTLRQALEIEPDDAETLQLLATLLVSQGREEEAEELAARLPEGAGLDAVSLLNMGIRRFNEGDVEGAHGFFQRAVEAAPEMASAHYYLGLTSMAQGLVEEAKRAFDRVLELDPDGEHAADAREFRDAL